MDRPYVHIYSESDKKKFENMLQEDKTWKKFLMVESCRDACKMFMEMIIAFH